MLTKPPLVPYCLLLYYVFLSAATRMIITVGWISEAHPPSTKVFIKKSQRRAPVTGCFGFGHCNETGQVDAIKNQPSRPHRNHRRLQRPGHLTHRPAITRYWQLARSANPTPDSITDSDETTGAPPPAPKHRLLSKADQAAVGAMLNC
jgi:hypothetical protein